MKVLFVVSAADKFTFKDGTSIQSGFWGEELVKPHKIFTENNWDIDFATPSGKPPSLDPHSLKPSKGEFNKKEVLDYLEKIKNKLNNPLNLYEVNEQEYDLLFYPGGHGPMEDLAYDKLSGKILADRIKREAPLALLCHSPAALLTAFDENNEWAFNGYKMTGLSNLEENINGTAKKSKWLLESKLKELGAKYSKAVFPFLPFVVVDRKFYTGQNPQSSKKLAKTIIAESKNW